MSHSESDRLALQLLEQLTESVRTLLAMDDDDLSFPTTHGCAMNGGVRRLLIHNAEHDRTHTSAISAARQRARQMQESELARLTQELIRQRAELVGQLLQMPDELLEAKAPERRLVNPRKRRAHSLLGERLDGASVDRGRCG